MLLVTGGSGSTHSSGSGSTERVTSGYSFSCTSRVSGADVPIRRLASAAQTAVLANLPSDAVAQSLNISHTAAAQGQTSSCAFWNLSSTELGAALMGDRFVEVEMAYDDSAGAPYWRQNDVNTLTFDIGRGLTTDVC